MDFLVIFGLERQTTRDVEDAICANVIKLCKFLGLSHIFCIFFEIFRAFLCFFRLCDIFLKLFGTLFGSCPEYTIGRTGSVFYFPVLCGTTGLNAQ